MDYDTELKRLQTALDFDEEELRVNRLGEMTSAQKSRLAYNPERWGCLWFIIGLLFIPITYGALYLSAVANMLAFREASFFANLTWLGPVTPVAAVVVICFIVSVRTYLKSPLKAVAGTIEPVVGLDSGEVQPRFFTIGTMTLYLPKGVSIDIFEDETIYTVYHTDIRDPFVVSAEPGDPLGIAKKKKRG
jgi:hypothetical protein